MLDRVDQGPPRRRGTDLVRVRETRTLSRNGRDTRAEPRLPAIYLSDLGRGRVITRVKWFVSTLIVAVSGLAIIGIVIYASMHIEGGSLFGVIHKVTREAMKPKAGVVPQEEKPVAVGAKTSKIVLSSKGLVTRNLIYDRVVQRRGTRDFISNRPYIRLTASLATDRPKDEASIPPFNPFDLLGNKTPIAPKDASAGDPSLDPRVSVRYVDVAGGFLPEEDGQELSNEEVERLVAETDAVYAESEASLSGGAEDEAASNPPPEKPEPNTSVLYKSGGDEDESGASDNFDTRSITAHGGDTLDAIIKGTGVDPMQAAQAADAIAKITKSKKLRAGEEVRLALSPSAMDEGAVDLAKLSLFYRGAAEATVARGGDGAFTANANPVQVSSDGDDAVGDRASVYASAWEAAETQDLPPSFITTFLKIYAYDVDFKTRVRAGDGFDLFYDLTQDENGVEKPGELLYAAITIDGETRSYYRFRTPDNAVDYYDDKGSNSKKFLMRTPVKGARMTSPFGWRKHPLLGTLRMHTGVDWAAPLGTPIMAAGNGTIEDAGRRGGYGNYIRIRHANGYKTAYGHMLRFAKGVAKGVKVRQGQIIGYIGSTGLSSGPHCHFEVLVNNRFVNPLAIKIPRSRQLQGRLLADFRREKARIDDLMHRSPVKTRVAAIEK